MRFYKIINNVTKEVFLTAQIDETTLCGINYKNKPLSNIEELLNLAMDNFTDLDSIALPLLNPDNLKIDLEEAISSSKENSGGFKIGKPYTPTEIWAAGVTYKSSEMERKRESETPDVYAKVYNSDRPEIFFKATKERSVGPFEEIGIRQDSSWNVPEAELALILFKNEIIGYTIGNDMSSRSIEGENPLYLPQAKTYNKCCAIGPSFVTPSSITNPNALTIQCSIFRNGKLIFKDDSSTSLMSRGFVSLKKWLTKSNTVPDMTTFLTGTPIIPPPEFSLLEGDLVQISITDIGTLENRVVTV
jgi:2-dehydro-3-deoxy-D-arabinonate dehydratase